MSRLRSLTRRVPQPRRHVSRRVAGRRASPGCTSRASWPRESGCSVCSIKQSPWLELGLLVAYDQYEGQAPGAGVITGVGVVEGREVVVVANDATVKAGSWWPETISKILRAQEVAMRQRIPIVYLVDSAGVNLPYQGGVFPGQYGAARIFYYNSIMRRYLHVPQISAVMGSCIAGGAYLPALSDVIFMVEGTSFMGLGGPNLVKGATGQTIDAETLGGARTHTELSAVAHYRAANDSECLQRIREYIGRLPANRGRGAIGFVRRASARAPGHRSLRSSCRTTTGSPTTCATCSPASSTRGALDEFQPDVAREMFCGHAHIEGRPVAVIANQRGRDQGPAGRAAAVRRNRLYRQRGEGRLLHRDREPGAPAAPLRPGRERVHGRARRRSSRASSAPARDSSRRWRRRWFPRSS